MSLNVILLDNDEKFIKFLDPDLIKLDETCERYKLNNISMVYKIDDAEKAKELFKVGHKILVNSDGNLKTCLYVINESLKEDFFSENEVEFEAEDVLSELNFAPLFSHTTVTSEKGFTIDSKGAVTVNRFALTQWFGDYFNIGVIQPVLNTYLQKISPVGTMTLMELLRYIEEETSNVFFTRYEIDPETNVIHRYLDFLNPLSKKDNWNLEFEYNVPSDYVDASETTDLNEDFNEDPETIHDESLDEGGTTTFDKDNLRLVDVTKLQLKIIEDGTLLKTFTANEIGLNGRSEEYDFTLDYNETDNIGELIINVMGYSYDETLAANPNTEEDMIETENTTITEQLTLGRNVTIQLYNSQDNRIIMQQTINPIVSDILPDVLDLGYNVENVTMETDESDTYKAVAPVLSLQDESSNNSLTKKDLGIIIENWRDLSIEKGDIVPMIVQKVNLTEAEKNNLGTMELSNNYYARPLKPNDSNNGSEGNTYEYFKATAYWHAPFNKISGELFVADDEDTGVEYDHINGKPDTQNGMMGISTPKLCTVETSEEDIYIIYNEVAMKLKDKRFPDLNIEVDVKNFKKHANNYNIFDKVYVKLPNVDGLVTASVNKTVKNAYILGENKVELINYSNTIKTSPARTMIDAETLTFSYPETVDWSVQLINLESEAEVGGKLITFSLYRIDENNNSNLVTSYNMETDDAGNINLTLGYNPGVYQMQIHFGGDEELAATSQTVDITVIGELIQSNSSEINYSASKKYKTKTKKSYWSKYGVSPDEKSILAIGKASTKNEIKKYGSKKLWKVKFKRKCKCGSTKLFWGYKWGSKFRGKTESGSNYGRIICDKCGRSYTIFGDGGKHDLTRIDPPVKSSSNEVTNLKKGRLLYDKWTVTVKPAPSNTNNKSVINRASNVKTQSGLVKQDVIKTAKNIVKNKTGVKAAKAIAKWISKHIKKDSREGFYQSPATTLSKKRGNDCCKADLFLHMCDAAGVMRDGIACYYVYLHKKKGSKNNKKIVKHVFCKVNGEWVDLTMKNPWGHYKTGYGAVKRASIKRYPYLPFNRKY